MSREFECRREVVLKATPEQVWEAVATTAGNAGWLFPNPISPDGPDTKAWDPPHHFAVRTEQGDWFNAVEYEITARDGSTTILRYMHNGIFQDDWDNQFDAVQKHTDFYLHTLGEYLEHFAGRTATYIGDTPRGIEAPASTASPDGFARLQAALGLEQGAAQGDTVTIEPDGLGPIEAIVDYRTAHFLGLRTGEELYCFFGRNAFGAPVGMSIHSFVEGVDATAVQRSWRAWLEQALA
jgi:uncharacterized protein YndB with AHSA1/START domain